MLGGDDSRRIWAILGNGFRIGACAEGTWTLYDPDHGWHQGYASGLVTDRQGRLWTVAGAKVRRFDPQTQAWVTVATADEVFGPMPNGWEPVRFLTGVEIDSVGNVWVGNCIRDGIVINAYILSSMPGLTPPPSLTVAWR